METSTFTTEAIWHLLEQVKDPEIPVISVVDLGIVRDVQSLSEEGFKVVITPTYSGCPAMNIIEKDILTYLRGQGLQVEVETVLFPAWTTDWISEKGRKNMEAYGIQPPVERTVDKSFLTGGRKTVPCPNCGSKETQMVSQFGSTACKSLYQCQDCREPFDYFKCI
ncbi:MAG: 1,2-phenylacetyl-CoA epoxidase subunit PaaD [Salibacteraceae bacterium]